MPIDHSQEQKQTPAAPIRDEKRWLEENGEAMETYNRRIEEEGVFSDDLRRF